MKKGARKTVQPSAVDAISSVTTDSTLWKNRVVWTESDTAKNEQEEGKTVSHRFTGLSGKIISDAPLCVFMYDLAAKEPLKDVQLEEGPPQRFNLTYVRPLAHRMCFSPAIIHTKKILFELPTGHKYFHTISEHHTARRRLLFLGKRKDFSELFHREQMHHPDHSGRNLRGVRLHQQHQQNITCVSPSTKYETQTIKNNNLKDNVSQSFATQ